MSCVGVGWIIWKDEALLPKELMCVARFSGVRPTPPRSSSADVTVCAPFPPASSCTTWARPSSRSRSTSRGPRTVSELPVAAVLVNSRSPPPLTPPRASPAAIIGQYFTFLNLGFQGYKDVMANDLVNARHLSHALENSGHFKVLSDVHRRADGAKSVLGGAKEALGVEDEDDPLLYKQYVPASLPLERIGPADNRPHPSLRTGACPSSRSASPTPFSSRTPTSSRSGSRSCSGSTAGSYPTTRSRRTCRPSTSCASSCVPLCPCAVLPSRTRALSCR